MITEEIYSMIDDSIDTEPMDQHLYNNDLKDDANESDRGCVKMTYKIIQQKTTTKIITKITQILLA